jgi:hypothetical protein
MDIEAHAARHQAGGDDVVNLDELGAPTGPVDFNGQKATGLAAGTATGDAARYDELHAHEIDTSNPHSVTAAQAGAIPDAADSVKDTHIDWGAGASQVDADDVPESATKKWAGETGADVTASHPCSASGDKADKVTTPTAGDFAGLDADGNLTDSGHKDADYADAVHAAEHKSDGSDVLNHYMVVQAHKSSVDVSQSDAEIFEFTAPAALTLSEVQVYCTATAATASVDVKEAGVSVLLVAATPSAGAVVKPTISDSAIASGAAVTVHVTTDGTGTITDLTVTLVFTLPVL